MDRPVFLFLFKKSNLILIHRFVFLLIINFILTTACLNKTKTENIKGELFDNRNIDNSKDFEKFNFMQEHKSQEVLEPIERLLDFLIIVDKVNRYYAANI